MWSNGGYLDGLTAQLPTYLNAEKAKHGIFLLIKVGMHEKKLKRIKRAHATLKKNGAQMPDLVIIDALEQLFAGKLKGPGEFDFSDELQRRPQFF